MRSFSLILLSFCSINLPEQESGQALRQKVDATMQELVDKDPSLLDKDRSSFHATVMKELER